LKQPQSGKPFRPVCSLFLAGKAFKPFIALALCLSAIAAISLWFSAGLLFAGGRQDTSSASQAGGTVSESALPGEMPETGASTPDRAVPARALSRMAAIPGSLRPGEPVTVGLAVPREETASLPDAGENPPLYAVLIDGQGEYLCRTAFFAVPGIPNPPSETVVLAAVLAVPSTARPGKFFIKTEPSLEGLEEIPLTVTARDFVFETIDLNEENTGLRTLSDPQKTAEARQLWAILHRQGNRVYTGEVFEAPVSSTRRTSFFGDRRIYRYIDGSTDSAIHAGIDYGVPRGTPVHACASGKVVLARSRIVTGNSVVIEHLPGLYSLYYHLDTIAVSEGDIVEKQALLGKSGSTGLATGPHLHWEIRAAGENTDPDMFMSRPVLDKTVIFSKLFE
jgi:murein DD-endopeptidase MepM/ murein hydrolase activator NlpD